MLNILNLFWFFVEGRVPQKRGFGGLFVFFHRPEGRSGDFDFSCGAVVECDSDCSKIWQKSSFFLVVCVADVVAYHWPFSADVAFS